MNISSVFEAVAHKQLTAVDLPGLGSNQHELNGIAALRTFFGTTDPVRGTITWHHFADDLQPTTDDGEFTFYDARAKSVGSSPGVRSGDSTIMESFSDARVLMTR